MARHNKPTPQRAQAVGPPQPQTLQAPADLPRRRAGFPPRFTLALGARIGDDLTVIGHLSAGNISELYQVWSTSYLCALTCKILLPQFPPQAKEVHGLQREARLLRRLAHPHIVHIFGQGTHANRPFLVQEYLHGPSLGELLDAAPHRQLPLAEAVKAMLHVCAAVTHLHERGYLHRDIKPANILLRGGIPVLVDFDVAYRLQASHIPRDCLGTDPYMAPEQCLPAALSPATDVYGIGAVLYELVTGRWPFEDDLLATAERHTRADRYPQTRGKPPPAPGRFHPHLPPGFAAVVLRCLAPRPTQRYQSVRALAHALVPFLHGDEQLWPAALEVPRQMV